MCELLTTVNLNRAEKTLRTIYKNCMQNAIPSKQNLHLHSAALSLVCYSTTDKCHIHIYTIHCAAIMHTQSFVQSYMMTAVGISYYDADCDSTE